MKPIPLALLANPDEPLTSPGPYDRASDAEEELWFLPPDAESVEGLEPLPRTARPPLFDPKAWRAAQGDLSGDLAELAAAFGALDERLRSGPEGWGQRLALLEVADLGWWTGDRIAVDRLALWIGLRLSGVQEDSLALARAGWAVRRLTTGPGPAAGGWRPGLGTFLGRPSGEAASDIGDLAEVLETVEDLHPVTRAAVAFHAWKMLGQGPSRDLEAAVLAARHGAEMGRGISGGSARALGPRAGGASFLPLALSAGGGLRGSGSEGARLAAWIAGATQAVLAALLHLDRLHAWQGRVQEALSDLQGRTPRALCSVLADWPVVSAPMAEAQSGASRAAVQRGFDLMTERGLIREVTGQGRYRVWAAKL